MDYIYASGHYNRTYNQENGIPRLRDDAGVGSVDGQVGEDVHHHLREGVVDEMDGDGAPEAVGLVVYPAHEDTQAERGDTLLEVAVKDGEYQGRHHYGHPRLVAGEQPAADYATAQQLFAQGGEYRHGDEHIHRTGGVKHLLEGLAHQIGHREQRRQGFQERPCERGGDDHQCKQRQHGSEAALAGFVQRDIPQPRLLVAARCEIGPRQRESHGYDVG